MFKKTFYVIVGRLELVSYHLVFYYHVLKEFKRDLPAFLLGRYHMVLYFFMFSFVKCYLFFLFSVSV